MLYNRKLIILTDNIIIKFFAYKIKREIFNKIVRMIITYFKIYCVMKNKYFNIKL